MRHAVSCFIKKEKKMRSILIKDFLEHKLNLIIILAAAILSLICAAYLEMLDVDVARFLLFVLQGPFFLLLISDHAINSEVSNKNFQFLATLPISRTKLWAAKLLFLIGFGAIIYAFYIVLLLFIGDSLSEIITAIIKAPTITLMLPLLIIAFGYFSSMLPRGFGFIAGLIILPFGAAIYFNKYTIVSINYSLAAIVFILIFLALSAIIFKIDRKMNSPWRGLNGIGFLILGLTLFFMLWSSINYTLEHTGIVTPKLTNIYTLTDNGNKVLYGKLYKTPWWDVIQDYQGGASEYVRLFSYDVNSQKSTQVGTRNTFFQDIDLGNKYFIAQTPIITAGFLRNYEAVVYDIDGNEVLRLPENSYHRLNRRSVFSIDDDRFMYRGFTVSDGTIVTDFYLYESGKGSRIVHTSQSGAFNHESFFKIPAKNNQDEPLIVIAVTDREKRDQMILISVGDGKQIVLPNPTGRYVTSVPGAMIFKQMEMIGRSKRTRSFVKVSLDGNITKLDWLNPSSKFIGTTAQGKTILAVPSEKQPHYWNPGDTTSWFSEVALVDFANQNLIKLTKLDENYRHNFIVHPSKQKGIMTSYRHEDGKSYYKNQVFSFDTMSLTHLPELDGLRIAQRWGRNNITALPENRFSYLLASGGVLTIDLDNLEVEKSADFSHLIKKEVGQ